MAQDWETDPHIRDAELAGVAINMGWGTTWPMPPELLFVLSGWFKKRGLYLQNIYSFIRRPHQFHPYEIHVDQHMGQLCSASLVIPCLGHGPMIWYRGDYRPKPHKHHSGANWSDLDWVDGPYEIHKEEIPGPSLCKVDIPHTALCMSEEPRITVTMRFRTNPSFDDLAEIFDHHRE
jgi:hypothetical protein